MKPEEMTQEQLRDFIQEVVSTYLANVVYIAPKLETHGFISRNADGNYRVDGWYLRN